MATLKIIRKKDFMGSIRNYILFIDGKEYQPIKNGETVTVELSQGKHSIKTRRSFSSKFSNEVLVNIDNTESKQLEISVSNFWKVFYSIFTGISTVLMFAFYKSLQDVAMLVIALAAVQYLVSLFFKKQPFILLNAVS